MTFLYQNGVKLLSDIFENSKHVWTFTGNELLNSESIYFLFKLQFYKSE